MSVLIRFDGAQASGKTVLRKAITRLLVKHGATVQERELKFKFNPLNENDDLIVSNIDFAALSREDN